MEDFREGRKALGKMEENECKCGFQSLFATNFLGEPTGFLRLICGNNSEDVFKDREHHKASRMIYFQGKLSLEA